MATSVVTAVAQYEHLLRRSGRQGSGLHERMVFPFVAVGGGLGLGFSARF